MLLSLAAAVTLHLGLLLAPAADEPWRGVVAAPDSGSPPESPRRSWVRVLDGAPALPRPRQAEAPDAPAAVHGPVLAAPRPAPAHETAHAPTPPAPPAAQAAPAALDAPYLPRAQLDRGPQVLEPVDLPYPAQAPAGEFRAVLTLLIDADGRVQRVRVDEGRLPAMLEDAARQAFLGARFSPGEKDGAAVRSRVRVEVRYNAEALAPAAPEPAATPASR